MHLSSKDQILKVMALTRFNFIAGMPKSGARSLSTLLSQNPRFAVTSDGPAAEVFARLSAVGDDAPLQGLGSATRAAVLRAALDAVHHARPMDAAVFDNSSAWLPHIRALSTLMPMSRFVVMVREPAAIAAQMARESGAAQPPSALLRPDGIIGAPLRHISDALTGPAADRLLLIDHDRLMADPDWVMRALYGFLREPAFAHDLRILPASERAREVKVGALARRVSAVREALSGRRPQDALPIWRRCATSAATVLLAEAG